MSTPLAVAEVQKNGNWTWRTLLRSRHARGLSARRVVFLRAPTPEERQEVEPMLAFYPDAKPACCLEDLLDG
jgi:hypothetical protein